MLKAKGFAMRTGAKRSSTIDMLIGCMNCKNIFECDKCRICGHNGEDM